MRRKFLLFLLTISYLCSVSGQTGTEFWFAGPDISAEHANNSTPIYLHITATLATHVQLLRPAVSPVPFLEFDLGEQQTQSIRLDDPVGLGLDYFDIEVYARNVGHALFKQDKGIQIKAIGGEITAYVEYTGSGNSPPHNLNNNNTDIVALKSNNALGTKFWVTTQRKYKNHGYSDDYSGFVIVATENGTIVNIDPKGNNLLYHGTTPFSVTLDKGQAIAIRAAGQAPAQHIAGVRVTTTNNKKIAITVFDDSMQITDGGGSWDLFADQLVPEELVGYEYIVMKGNIQDNNDATNPFDGEAIFITPTMDNTDIYINGALVATNIPAGGYFEYVIKVHPTHVRATNPVYLNHISGWQSPSVSPFVGRELGGAILPTIDGCTGSHSVTLKKTPATNFYYYINIMVRNDTAVGSPTRNQAIHHFTYSINNGPPM